MPLESATWATQLNTSNPQSSDPRSQGDDHLRLIKDVAQREFNESNREWARVSHSASFQTSTAFRLTGDRTGMFHGGRRIKAVGNSTGTIYGSVTSSTFSSATAVNIEWDSGGLQNESFGVWLGATTPRTIPGVPSRKQLRFIDGSSGYRRVVVDNWAGGNMGTPRWATWVSGDQSSKVSADTNEIAWVAPASDRTGQSGAWRGEIDGAVNVLWAGAVPDYDSNTETGTDNTPMVQAAIDFAGIDGRNVLIPAGEWYFQEGTKLSGAALVIGASDNGTSENIRLTGEGPTMTGGPGTRLYFAGITNGQAIHVRSSGVSIGNLGLEPVASYDAKTNNMYGIYFDDDNLNVGYHEVDHLFVRQWSRGIAYVHTIFANLRNIRALGCTRGVSLEYQSGQGGEGTTLYAENLYLASCTYGLWGDHANQSTIVAPILESNSTAGIHLQDCRELCVVGAYFESNTLDYELTDSSVHRIAPVRGGSNNSVNFSNLGFGNRRVGDLSTAKVQTQALEIFYDADEDFFSRAPMGPFTWTGSGTSLVKGVAGLEYSSYRAMFAQTPYNLLDPLGWSSMPWSAEKQALQFIHSGSTQTIERTQTVSLTSGTTYRILCRPENVKDNLGTGGPASSMVTVEDAGGNQIASWDESIEYVDLEVTPSSTETHTVKCRARGDDIEIYLHGLCMFAEDDDAREEAGHNAASHTLPLSAFLAVKQRSSDPPDPPAGEMICWQSDGTGSGADGDIMMKITDSGGTTKTTTLVDYSTI